MTRKIYKIDGVEIYLLFDYNVDNTDILDSIYSTHSIIFLLTSWYKSKQAIRIANNNKNYNIVILANSEEERIFFEENVNCYVIYCNNNAFLNENAFYVDDIKYRKYDLVVDSCFRPYKNVNIANKMHNTIHIGYFKKIPLLPNFGKIANYKNNTYIKLNAREICEIYNESNIAGIFSLCEGACFASTQYLLSGLPVVSTQSKGGRDIWFNDRNSIICENNAEDCMKCCKIAKQRLLTGEFNRHIIRNDTIALMTKFRNIFIDYLIQYLKEKFNIQMSKTSSIDLAIF
jgi:hypothetical protein